MDFELWTNGIMIRQRTRNGRRTARLNDEFIFKAVIVYFTAWLNCSTTCDFLSCIFLNTSYFMSVFVTSYRAIYLFYTALLS